MICCLNPDCPNPRNPDGREFCQTCNTPLVSLLRNRFRVMRVLSDEGGFGRTYLAEDVDKLNELCVVKQLAPKFQGTWSQKKAMELFADEAKRLQELGEHPQIPTLIAYFEQDDCWFLVQQFIDGHNLLKELQIRKVYKDWDIQAILLDLLPILKFIHEQGVIHRDIKPENIIRRQVDGRLTLIDFGSSKLLTPKGRKKVGTSIGSHGYSPIEQIRDGKAYPSSDLFSLGATCFHLLTGISPFQLWMEHGFGWVNQWQNYLRYPLDTDLAAVMDRLLQKDMQQRYQSAEEVIKDLTKKYNHLLPPAPNLPRPAANNYPFASLKKYIFWRNLLIIVAMLAFIGLGEAGYRHFRRLQAGLTSSLSQPQPTNSETDVYRSPQKIGKNITLVKTLSGHEDRVLSVVITPDGKMIASSGDRVIRLWNLITGEEVAELTGHSQRVNVIVLSPDGQTLISGSDDKTIKVWNLATGKLILTLSGHTDSVHALAVSRDGQTLISGSDDKTIKVWNLATGKLIRNLVGHTYWVRSVAVSPDGGTVASGSFDKTIKLWNISKTASPKTLEPNSQTVTSVAFSPDGKILATASRDRQMKIWQVSTGEKVRTLTTADHNVTTIAFSPDGKILAGGRERLITLWNVDTGAEIATLTGHTQTITSLAFSADNTFLISGAEDNTIKIWRVGN
ncbi:MAG TPA: serine/threonine-protein kinase [Nostocaceae cyanobacterium]|nr:serine/threonine-protein kinase [Nostocaceae cyanobacterium]